MVQNKLPRIFKIINKDNEEANLNDLKTFADEPQGLGLSLSHTMYTSIHGATISDTDYSNNDLQFSMTFGFNSNPYEDFNKFANIISKPPLTLKYEVPYIGEYQRKVVVKSLTKKDIDKKWDCLLSDLTLTPISPWFQWVEIAPDKIDEGDLYKTKGYYNRGTEHRYTYDYHYSVSSNTIRYLATIDNDSVIPVENAATGLKIVITADESTGPIVNPEWRLLDSKYQEIQNERLFVTVDSGSQLVVNSAYGEELIHLYGPLDDNVDNGSKYIDPTTKGFIQAPIGTSYLQLLGGWKNQLTSIADPHIKIYLRKEWGVI